MTPDGYNPGAAEDPTTAPDATPAAPEPETTEPEVETPEPDPAAGNEANEAEPAEEVDAPAPDPTP